MAWLVGAAIIVAIIYFMIISPGFRAFAFILLIIVGGGIFVLVTNANKESEVRQQQRAEQEHWAVTAIRPDEILLSDVSLVNSSLSWTLKGKISNQSKFNLSSVSFSVTIRDCPHTSNTCQIIGQESTKTNNGSSYLDDRTTLVPSGQVRLFETYSMGFKNMPPATNPRWDYQVTEIRATR